MNRQDIDREERIAKSYLELCCATDRKTRKAAADLMVAEIRQRSAERVAQMEAQKGLAR